MGDLEKAERAAKRAVHPQWKLIAEANIHAAKQEWQQAIDKFEQLNRLDPGGQPVNRYQAAQYYFEMGKYDKAIAEVAKSQNFYAPQFRAYAYPLGFHLLGKIYEKKGDTQFAIENYEKFLDLWKNADEALPDLIDAKARLARLKGTSKK
jgi:tetratricopeptide (TPR) repeat protein